jgi:hypothetical protein
MVHHPISLFRRTASQNFVEDLKFRTGEMSRPVPNRQNYLAQAWQSFVTGFKKLRQ